jgi:hypothetical protein
MEDHWFDKLSLMLTQRGQRRALWRAAGAIMTSSSLAGQQTASAKRKHRHHKNDKPHHSSPPQSCRGGMCAAQWPDDQANRDYCEFICQQCDGNDPREFCIVEGDPADPAKVAVCCEQPAINCCSGHCTNLRDDPKNCGSCGHTCPPGVPCTDRQCACPAGKTVCADGCVDTSSNSRNCRHCGEQCPEGWSCCDGTCFDIEYSSTNCGGCGVTCPLGQVCISGHCGCPQGQVPCNKNCIFEGFKCCPDWQGGYGCSDPNAVCDDKGTCG